MFTRNPYQIPHTKTIPIRGAERLSGVLHVHMCFTCTCGSRAHVLHVHTCRLICVYVTSHVYLHVILFTRAFVQCWMVSRCALPGLRRGEDAAKRAVSPRGTCPVSGEARTRPSGRRLLVALARSQERRGRGQAGGVSSRGAQHALNKWWLARACKY